MFKMWRLKSRLAFNLIVERFAKEMLERRHDTGYDLESAEWLTTTRMNLLQSLREAVAELTEASYDELGNETCRHAARVALLAMFASEKFTYDKNRRCS